MQITFLLLFYCSPYDKAPLNRVVGMKYFMDFLVNITQTRLTDWITVNDIHKVYDQYIKTLLADC